MTKPEINEQDSPLMKSLGVKPRRGSVKKCVVCDKEFYRKPSSVGGKYCSYKCMSIGMTDEEKKTTKDCKGCGKEFKVYKSYLSARPSTSFCSKKCEGEYRTRLANPNKDGGIPSIKTAKTRQMKKKKPGNGMRTADNLFSKYIRLRDGKCLHCGATQGLQCSHIKGRSWQRVRYDDDNAIALCLHCHIYWWHKDPMEASSWFKETFPGRWERINEKINAGKVKMDYEKIKEILHEKIREIENG